MLAFDPSGRPFNVTYQAPYRSCRAALDEAAAIFVAGAAVREAWRGRAQFTICELGFGLGTTFLATLDVWRADPDRCARLHFISIETQLPDAPGLVAAHRALGIDSADAQRLAADWPEALPGLHRIEFADGRVALTVAIGSVESMLGRLDLAADAFYLDGFAPEKNPAMWTPAVMKTVARLARPGARLATSTPSAPVRDALVDAGFEVELASGPAPHGQRWVGRYAPRWSGHQVREVAVRVPAREAIVVGAGIAGCAVASELARRGWTIRLLERRDAPAREGSAQPMLADHLHLSPDDNVLARLTRAALLLAPRSVSATDPEERGWTRTGKLLVARDADALVAQRAMLDKLGFPRGFAQLLDRSQASEVAGTELLNGGLWLSECRIANPATLCAAWLRDGGSSIDYRLLAPVERLARLDGGWVALDRLGAPLAQAPVVVLACAASAPTLASMRSIELRRMRGQATVLRATSRLAGLRAVIGGDAYACPLGDGRTLIGATYDDLESPEPDHEADRSNLRRLARLLVRSHEADAWVAAMLGNIEDSVVGFRYVAGDRLPLIGPIVDETLVRSDPRPFTRNDRLVFPRQPGLYGAFGFGSRGLLWATLAAQVLACAIEGEPAPIETDLLESIAPSRFLRRAVRRSRLSAGA